MFTFFSTIFHCSIFWFHALILKVSPQARKQKEDKLDDVKNTSAINLSSAGKKATMMPTDGKCLLGKHFLPLDPTFIRHSHCIS